MSDSNSSSENEPASIKINMDVTNIYAMDLATLLNRIKCDNKYIIHNYESEIDSGNDANTIFFVDDYMDFHTMIMDICKNSNSDSCIHYKSYNDNSCIISILYYGEHDRYLSQYQIFGVNEHRQSKLLKSISKSLKKIGMKLGVKNY